ncbi:MAG: YbcC family protein [Methylophilaceae bacterium]
MSHMEVVDMPAREYPRNNAELGEASHEIESNLDESLSTLIDRACQIACQAIAPAWPLDRSIAVNPHWGRISDPVRKVAARLALLGGMRVYPSRRYFQQAWNEKRISTEDLLDAIAQVNLPERDEWDIAKCVAALDVENQLKPLPLLIDLLDDGLELGIRLPWRQAVTHQISQTCAAYFDQHQADWQPQRQHGLYSFWRETLTHDHGIGILMGLPKLDRQLENLPKTPELAQSWVLKKLGLPPAAWSYYLEALLLTMNGWASWCSYLQWQAAQEGRVDSNLRELLAIRLAWGAILLDGVKTSSAESKFLTLQKTWSDLENTFAQAEEAFCVEEIWQIALEAGYQRRLTNQLSTNNHSAPAKNYERNIDVQAVFCIDVRSEPVRRALEEVDANIQTIGFAGFFGLAIDYTPLGTSATRPQLPGLLAPRIAAKDTLKISDKFKGQRPTLESANEARQRYFSLTNLWQSASRWPASAFSFVEAFGWVYVGKMTNLLRIKPEKRSRDDLDGLPTHLSHMCRPSLEHIDIYDRINIAANVLHAMGLKSRFASLVLLVGHGSQSRNNPLASALDCGACCGQTGEVNARVLASILNNSMVREGLLAHGIQIPQNTVFVAALHNTTTEELEWFDQDLLPEFVHPSINILEKTFARALDQVRRERAPLLQIDPQQDAKNLLNAFQKRASDSAQTRPEWGLAGNASFIIGPRKSTRCLKLDGRSFLHDYDASQDDDGSILELLMTAPMLVTHWINWQYHSSTCEPTYFGSGNKVLHNVVGGHIGVFEGNGGDLRIGLSKQSLHDGQKCVHEPLRLTVAIAAPKERIEVVITKHKVLQELVDNGWLHLWHFQDGTVSRFNQMQWQSLEKNA